MDPLPGRALGAPKDARHLFDGQVEVVVEGKDQEVMPGQPVQGPVEVYLLGPPITDARVRGNVRKTEDAPPA
jgi:hypothetical protein